MDSRVFFKVIARFRARSPNFMFSDAFRSSLSGLERPQLPLERRDWAALYARLPHASSASRDIFDSYGPVPTGEATNSSEVNEKKS
jgi:hypothetical protein